MKRYQQQYGQKKCFNNRSTKMILDFGTKNAVIFWGLNYVACYFLGGLKFEACYFLHG